MADNTFICILTAEKGIDQDDGTSLVELYNHIALFSFLSNVHDKFPAFFNIPDLTFCLRNRRSYMCALALMIILKELGKRNKMLGLPTFLYFFLNWFNKLIN